VETALFRIAQEALTNVLKHARASRAVLRLQVWMDRVSLTIRDDGQGFDPRRLGRPGGASGWGTVIMRERAEAVGGEVQVESAPGEGTSITIDVPR
jgi:signal transduction histidine kinase